MKPLRLNSWLAVRSLVCQKVCHWLRQCRATESFQYPWERLSHASLNLALGIKYKLKTAEALAEPVAICGVPTLFLTLVFAVSQAIAAPPELSYFFPSGAKSRPDHNRHGGRQSRSRSCASLDRRQGR